MSKPNIAEVANYVADLLDGGAAKRKATAGKRRILVRISKALSDTLTSESRKRGRSVQAIVEHAIAGHFSEPESKRILAYALLPKHLRGRRAKL